MRTRSDPQAQWQAAHPTGPDPDLYQWTSDDPWGHRLVGTRADQPCEIGLGHIRSRRLSPGRHRWNRPTPEASCCCEVTCGGRAVLLATYGGNPLGMGRSAFMCDEHFRWLMAHGWSHAKDADLLTADSDGLWRDPHAESRTRFQRQRDTEARREAAPMSISGSAAESREA